MIETLRLLFMGARPESIGIAVLLTISGLASTEGHAQTGEEWVAKVGGQTITCDAFSRRYSAFLGSIGGRDNIVARKSILENMINEVLLLKIDRTSNIESNPAFQSALRRTNTQAVLAYLKDLEIYAKINVTDRETRIAFQRANERLAARHLFARTEDEAHELSELLKLGVDFETLAQRTFADSTLKSNGGYLGYFSWGDMDPAFEEAAYAMRVGDVSGPVQTVHGFSIIKLEDRISTPLLTENQYLTRRQHLERVVRLRKKAPAEREYLASVFNRDKVEYHEAGMVSVSSGLNQRLRHPDEGSPIDDDRACVSHENRTYTSREILEKLLGLRDDQLSSLTTQARIRAAIRGLLLQDRLSEIARQKGFDTAVVVLEAQAKTKDALLLAWKLREITESMDVSDLAARTYYNENAKQFVTEDEINVQEILVADAHVADSLAAAIRSGASLSDAARAHSLRRRSASNNGELGLAPVSRFGQLRDVLWGSPLGELVGPIRIGDIYGLFRVVKKAEGRPMAFERVEARVRRLLQFDHQRETAQNYLSTLKKKTDVRINEENLASLEFGDTRAHASTNSRDAH